VQPAGADPADRLRAGDVFDDAIAFADFGPLLLGAQVGHDDVVGRAVARDLVAGVVQRLYRVGPALDGEAVGIDGRADARALADLHDAPDADVAAVVGVRDRGEVHFEIGFLFEVAAFGERLEGDGKRRADELAVGPCDGSPHVASAVRLTSITSKSVDASTCELTRLGLLIVSHYYKGADYEESPARSSAEYLPRGFAHDRAGSLAGSGGAFGRREALLRSCQAKSDGAHQAPGRRRAQGGQAYLHSHLPRQAGARSGQA